MITSKTNILGSLETIAILLHLSKEKPLHSGQIQSLFPRRSDSTINSRLRKLAEGGLIEIVYLKDVGKKILPGGKKNEYILTKEGDSFRKEIVSNVLKLFKPVLENIYKKKEPPENKESIYDADDVQNFVMDVSDDINPHARSPESMEVIQEILIKNLTRFLRGK